LDLSDAVDVTAERKRLQKDLAVAEKELAQTEGKLGNQSFTAKAPANVVDGIKARRQTAAADIERITGRLAALPRS
jgi:valyl-tRNA synthetase